MNSTGKRIVFRVVFPNADEFRRAFLRKDVDPGIFIPSTRKVPVGTEVVLKLGVVDRSQRVSLRAIVTKRRARSAGPGLPAGIHASLRVEERDRIDAIARFFSTNETIIERRKHERLPVLIPARYRTAEGEFDSTTRDLSRGGAFIHCEGPLLHAGARFPLRLFLKEQKGSEIELEAEVAWVYVMRTGKGMGLAFVSDSPSIRQFGKAIKRLESSFR